MSVCAGCKGTFALVAPDTGLCSGCEAALDWADDPAPLSGAHEVRTSYPTRLLFALVGLAVVVGAVGAAWWWNDRRQVGEAYAEALGACQVDPEYGSARIDALDRLYGRDARPSDLLMQLSLCQLNSNVDALRRLQLR